MASMFNWYLRVLKTYPWKTQSLTAGILMTAGDVIAQTTLEKKKILEIEKKRTARFGFIGTVYIGPALHTWYLQLEKIFGVAGRTVGLKKMLLDQLTFAPFFICGILVLNDVLQKKPWAATRDHLKSDYFSVLQANYMLWPGTQLVTFYVVPIHFRVLFVSTVALVWNTYLAWKTNSSKPEELLILNEETDESL